MALEPITHLKGKLLRLEREVPLMKSVALATRSLTLIHTQKLSGEILVASFEIMLYEPRDEKTELLPMRKQNVQIS